LSEKETKELGKRKLARFRKERIAQVEEDRRREIARFLEFAECKSRKERIALIVKRREHLLNVLEKFGLAYSFKLEHKKLQAWKSILSKGVKV